VLGLNARQVKSPPATGVQPRLSAPTKYVPLSQFFLQLNGATKVGGKKLYGYKEKAVAGAIQDVVKDGGVWTFMVDGTKVVLDKAQRVAFRSVKAGMTTPQRFTQLEKKGLVVRFGERQANKQWVSGKTTRMITGYLTPLGERVFDLMQGSLGEAKLNLDQIKADIMSDDPLTYGAYSQDDLSGSLKDRIEEIVYNHAYEAASGHRDEASARRALEVLFALAKKEKFQAVAEKAWRDGLKDGAGNLPAAGKSEATTTATVATTAVPLGMETDKRKLRRGKPSNLSGRVAGLLRRLF
jgi:hypothetical protein